MLHLILVAAGGAIGASARHAVNMAAFRLAGPAFPWGTMAVNLVGSFLMGLLAAVLARRFGGSTTELRLFLGTGVLSGFTTFSAYSLDVVVLWERGAFLSALAYAAGSVAFALAALIAGLMLGRLALG